MCYSKKTYEARKNPSLASIYMALCQELGLTKNNKDADAVKDKLALDCIVAFKRLQKT